MADLNLYPHQFETVADTKSPARILRGGYGSGKTRCLVAWAAIRSLQNAPHCKVLVVEPTWKQVKKVLVPEFIKVFDLLGIDAKYNKTDHTFTHYEGRTIWMESGEVPENMSGFTVACAGIDEPEMQDEEVDRRVTSRVRDPDADIRQILYTGTPEGLTWLDEKTKEVPTIVVPTDANKSLPADYVKRMLDRFKGDPIRLDMYFRGIARSLAGSIYTCLEPRHMRACANPKDGELVTGWDFNTRLMCTPIARVLGEEIHVFTEVVSRHTRTEEHANRVREHLVALGLGREQPAQFDDKEVVGPNGQRIDAWADATGGAERTSSSKTDLRILREAGFWPRSAKSNPRVKDRIEAVQYALAHDLLFIDPQGAPMTAMALKKHEYERNSSPPQPRKKWRDDEDPLDDINDALGYMVYGLSPLRSRGG